MEKPIVSPRRRLQNRLAQQKFRERQRHKAVAATEQSGVAAPDNFDAENESSPLDSDNVPVQWHKSLTNLMTAATQIPHTFDLDLGSTTTPSCSLPDFAFERIFDPPDNQPRPQILQQTNVFSTESNDSAMVEPQGLLTGGGIINSSRTTSSTASASPSSPAFSSSYDNHGSSSSSFTSSMTQAYATLPTRNYYKRPNPKDPLLHIAVRTHKTSMVRLLLRRGASLVNEQDINDRTALHVAALTGDEEMVETLLMYGADPQALDRDGLDPLRCAVEQGHEVVVEKLLDAVTWKIEEDFAKRNEHE